MAEPMLDIYSEVNLQREQTWGFKDDTAPTHPTPTNNPTPRPLPSPSLSAFYMLATPRGLFKGNSPNMETT